MERNGIIKMTSWVCRDDADILWIFQGDMPPYKDYHNWWHTEEGLGYTYLPDELYPEVTYCSDPLQIEMTIVTGDISADTDKDGLLILTGFIVRNFNETLWLYIDKVPPYRDNFYWNSDSMDCPMELWQSLFPDVLWENENPLPVTILIKH